MKLYVPQNTGWAVFLINLSRFLVSKSVEAFTDIELALALDSFLKYILKNKVLFA